MHDPTITFLLPRLAGAFWWNLTTLCEQVLEVRSIICMTFNEVFIKLERLMWKWKGIWPKNRDCHFEIVTQFKIRWSVNQIWLPSSNVGVCCDVFSLLYITSLFRKDNKYYILWIRLSLMEAWLSLRSSDYNYFLSWIIKILKLKLWNLSAEKVA